jgi:glucose-6-phosphate isomerase
MNVPPLRQRPAWALLQAHYQTMKDRHLRQLFAQEPDRGERLSAEAAGIYLDYSKNRVTAETLQLLLQLGGRVGPSRPDRGHVSRRGNQCF